MRRIDDSATANAAAGNDAPVRIAPIKTTFAGSAQTMPTMNTLCQSVSPAAFANPAKPTKALERIKPGMENDARTPRKYQRRRL